MTTHAPLSQEKKLTIILRVEAGCLGPTGEDHVVSFCYFANKEFSRIDPDFLHWIVSPRTDKNQAELQYQIDNKTLNREQVKTYLKLFNRNLDEVEHEIHKNILHLIEQYMQRYADK